MTTNRSNAIKSLVADIESFSIDLDQYYGDAEPQAIYDSVLSGKLDALMCFCRRLGWSDLSRQLQELLPLQQSAPAALTLVKDFVIPEIRHLLERAEIDTTPDANESFWQLLHPRIVALARPRFVQGFYGDAIESCFKEVNDAVKTVFIASQGRELDGAGLMTSAFSIQNPVIRLTALQTTSDRDEQQGYMQIFAGSMTGIRNPKAHGNLNPDARKTLHLISLASLLLCRLDERL